MRSYGTAMNQYQSLQGWLAHYNQVLQSRPRVNTRHKDTYNMKNNKYQKSIESERKEHNSMLISKLMDIRHRPRKSVDDSTFYKPSLKNQFKQKQKIFQLEKSNIQLYNKLKDVKSSLHNLDAGKEKQLKRRQRFYETLHYQGQVYKTFTDFLRSNNHPRMYLRSEKESLSKKSKHKSPVFKVQVVEVCEDEDKEIRHKSKKKRKLKKIKSKKIGEIKVEDNGNSKSDETEMLDLNDGESVSSKV